MNKLILFFNFIQLLQIGIFGCYTSSGLNDQNDAVLENENILSNMIMIRDKKTCVINGSFDQIFICYNSGRCRTKNIFVNLTHYEQVSYCKCQLVITSFNISFKSNLLNF